MSCLLRASGKQFDVDSFLRKSRLTPCAVFHRGEPRSDDPRGRKRVLSGLNVVVSNASFSNIRRQIRDAVTFLRKNKTEIRKLLKYRGVEGADLDFGVDNLDAFCQSEEFPPELLSLAGTLGLSIRLSLYHK